MLLLCYYHMPIMNCYQTTARLANGEYLFHLVQFRDLDKSIAAAKEWAAIPKWARKGYYAIVCDPQGKQVGLAFSDDKCIAAQVVLPIAPKASALFTMTQQQRNELGGKKRHEVLIEFGQPSFTDFQRGTQGKDSTTTFYYDDVAHGKQVIVEFVEDECVNVDLK